ncbi:NYN domain-containing protein [Aneurinibacillus sp. Ricciae_BoGa-3]|uniref:NYN domain-containing protein n=1 Tax=Aneurinibacillus sp. Ricciae_BoGa-3 TaxID=3022697 RepID=UPI00233F83B9|nr:NYN domain-containing protein [Aneurinibacillus sp. Ricciae_BoGa-3]WCK54674.1 NYN domain-containing protein [Aneurinibacillus sp. Ricciae_BoGa-3]
MEQILIVDGYNVIGDWGQLKEHKENSLEEARNELLSMLADYQAYTGIKVIVVFDAYNVKGIGRKIKQFRLDIRYTKEKETADEMIERLVRELSHRQRQIYVATSDNTEQHVTFGYGALRKPVRELWIDVKQAQADIGEKVKKAKEKPKGRGLVLDDHVQKIFEKWRRGEH